MIKKYRLPRAVKNKPGSLVEATFAHLQGRDWKAVAADTGLPLAWLGMFARGGILAPSATRIQTLYEYLTGSVLPICMPKTKAAL